MLTTERLNEGAAEVSKNWFQLHKSRDLKEEDLRQRIVGHFEREVATIQGELKSLQDQVKNANDDRDKVVREHHDLKQRVEKLERFLESVREAEKGL